jgi:transcriptional regulator with XRE-family HTH domain/lambda repressor-like predicted transcriptional regulator
MAKLARNGRRPERRSDEAWVEVDRLLELGWTPRAIASAAGLSERTIRGALARRTEDGTHTWTTFIAAAILKHAEWPHEGHVPVIGSTRRLRALTAIGWTLDGLAHHSGMPMTTLSVIRAGRTNHIHADTRARIAWLYDALSMRPGTSDVARRIATKQKWASPLAWDDKAIDDPDATPQGVGVDRAPTIERIRDLEQIGLTRDQIAARLKLRRDTVDRTIARDRQAIA